MITCCLIVCSCLMICWFYCRDKPSIFSNDSLGNQVCHVWWKIGLESFIIGKKREWAREQFFGEAERDGSKTRTLKWLLNLILLRYQIFCSNFISKPNSDDKVLLTRKNRKFFAEFELTIAALSLRLGIYLKPWKYKWYWYLGTKKWRLTNIIHNTNTKHFWSLLLFIKKYIQFVLHAIHLAWPFTI